LTQYSKEKGKLYNLRSSPNIIRIIKSRRRRAGHVARMRKKRNAYRVSWENKKDRDHLEDLDLGRRIILKWILEK
jgi:hypothetical protein